MSGAIMDGTRFISPATTACVIIGLLTGASFTARGAEPSAQTALRVRVIDADTKQPIASRMYLSGADARWYFPRPTDPVGIRPYSRVNRAGSEEQHTTVSVPVAEYEVPQGRYQLVVERGKEYRPHAREVVVGNGPSEVVVELRRWIHMAERGWYSGDTHLHRELAEMPNLVLAEDLNIGFPLSHWITSADVDPVGGNRLKPGDIKAAVLRVADRHLIYPLNTEYELFSVGGKSHTLGAIVIIGHRTPLTVKAPPLREAADWARREGGLIDLERHSWPWSIAIVPLLPVDLMELANNHCWRTDFALGQWTIEAAGDYMRLERDAQGLTEWGWIDFGFQTYYALLNCGFKLKPTAGTGSGVHPVPVGFGRVYVEQPSGFSYENWMAGLRTGRSFVTTGPMLTVTVADQPLGSILQDTPAGSAVEVRGAVDSLAELDRIEIIVNGVVAKTLRPAARETDRGARHADFVDTITVERSSWIAVRAFEKHPRRRIRFAHTAPVYIEVSGRPLAPRREELDYLVRRVRDEIQRNRPVLAPEALAEFERALRTYEAITPRVD